MHSLTSTNAVKTATTSANSTTTATATATSAAKEGIALAKAAGLAPDTVLQDCTDGETA